MRDVATPLDDTVERVGDGQGDEADRGIVHRAVEADVNGEEICVEVHGVRGRCAQSASEMSLHASRCTLPSALAIHTVPERRGSELADTGLYQTGRVYSMRGTTTVWNSCQV